MAKIRTTEGLTEAFQQSNPKQVFRVAQDGYRTTGRGALIVKATAADQIDIHYTGRGELVTMLDANRADENAVNEVWERMNAYDPDVEFVVAYLAVDDLSFDTMAPNADGAS